MRLFYWRVRATILVVIVVELFHLAGDFGNSKTQECKGPQHDNPDHNKDRYVPAGPDCLCCRAQILAVYLV